MRILIIPESLWAVGIVSVFGFRHFNRCVIVSDLDFDYFPNGCGVKHLFICLSAITYPLWCTVRSCLSLGVYCWVLRYVFKYSGSKSIVGFVGWRYFLPVYDLTSLKIRLENMCIFLKVKHNTSSHWYFLYKLRIIGISFNFFDFIFICYLYWTFWLMRTFA